MALDKSFNQSDWHGLIERVQEGTCTPFIGAGASYPWIKLGGTIAAEWAAESDYPLADRENLARVAQYLALNPDGRMVDAARPKRKMAEYIRGCKRENGDDPLDTFNVLAEFPLPVYVTTNYDRFLCDALEAKGRQPVREYCRWNRRLYSKSPPDHGKLDPSAEVPLVYHLHGYDELVDSLVLTEDDYIDFIVNVSADPDRIPTQVQDAMTDNALLFLGYSLSDWNFKVFFRAIQSYLEKSTRTGHVSVQLVPGDEDEAEEQTRAVRYLERYFDVQGKIIVYWGTCREFIEELSGWWERG